MDAIQNMARQQPSSEYGSWGRSAPVLLDDSLDLRIDRLNLQGVPKGLSISTATRQKLSPLNRLRISPAFYVLNGIRF
jgi:hypothetical protein